MSIFDDLKSSLEEAVEVHEGKQAAARVTRYELALSPQKDIKSIRQSLQVSQVEFAKALGTSVDTIKSWESKRRNPTGLAAKVLATIEEDPRFYTALAAH